MKKKIADKWVKELRSGKYKQGRSRLNENENLCCLGVLCEIAHEAKIVEKVVHNYGGKTIYGYKGEDVVDEIRFPSYDLPPVAVSVWAGLKTSNGKFGDGTQDCLSAMNDFERKTFAEIADFIEANYKKL